MVSLNSVLLLYWPLPEIHAASDHDLPRTLTLRHSSVTWRFLGMTLNRFSTDTLYSPESFLLAGFSINVVVELGGAVSLCWMLASNLDNGTPFFHQVTMVSSMNRLWNGTTISCLLFPIKSNSSSSLNILGGTTCTHNEELNISKMYSYRN